MHTEETGQPKVRVFQWFMQEDPVGGVVAPKDRDRLRAQIASLRLQVDPTQRTIDRLELLLRTSRQVLARDGVIWSQSEAQQNPVGGETRLNALLALANQLAWLLEVYKDLPNTWVSIK